MSECPLQGYSSRGYVPYEQFYEIDAMRPIAQQILDTYKCNTCGPLKKIIYWVNKYYRYQTDMQNFGLVDYWQFPTEILETGSGDCDCLSFFIASLLEAVGIPTHVAIGNTPFGYHAWVECQDFDGEWYLVETTSGKLYPWAHRSKMGYKPDLYISPDGCGSPEEDVSLWEYPMVNV